MKKLFAIAAIVGLGFAAKAQDTNPIPTGLPGIGTTAFGYLTSFDTNSVTFINTRASLWTTAISEQGGVAPLLNELGASYDIWRPTPSTNATARTAVFLDLSERNTGVSGTISSVEGGVGFAVIVYDVRLELAADGGYNLERSSKQSHEFGEVNFDIMKGLGSKSHFAAGVGFFAQFPDSVQGLYAKMNASF